MLQRLLADTLTGALPSRKAKGEGRGWVGDGLGDGTSLAITRTYTLVSPHPHSLRTPSRGASPMSEIVNSVSPPKIQSRRCLVCRLPAELREEVERDRIRHRK